MTRRRVLITGVALLATAAALQAQTPTKTEKVKGTTRFNAVQMTGEVVWVQGNTLVAKMQPSGHYSVFNVQPGREFVIDGQTRHIGDLKPGTVLTATVTTKNQSVTVRTTSALNGTVWWVQGNYVILTLENGENKEFAHGPRVVQVHGGRQAGISVRTEDGHESIGHQDRRRAPNRDLVEDGHHGQGTEVGCGRRVGHPSPEVVTTIWSGARLAVVHCLTAATASKSTV